MFFDTHAHYWDERFQNETENGADTLLAQLFADGLVGAVNVGTSPITSQLAIAQAKRFEHMYTAVGIHPSDSGEFPKDPDGAVAEIEALIKNKIENKITALGEIGLDYHWDDVPKEHQMRYFEAQLTLAEETGLPIVIHDREAHGDVFATILKHPRVHGIFHSYSGSYEMARELLKRDFYISFSGTVTFKNAARIAEIASKLPRDRVLIETDAPYLTPHPFRGRLNHSGYLSYTAGALAELWQTDLESVAERTTENAKTIFGLK